MEQVLDLYEQPYDADYSVICLDEFPKQLIEQPVFTTSQVQRGGGQHEVLVVVVSGNWLAVESEAVQIFEGRFEIELHRVAVLLQIKRNLLDDLDWLGFFAPEWSGSDYTPRR